MHFRESNGKNYQGEHAPGHPQKLGPSALQFIGVPTYSAMRTLLLQNLMKPLLFFLWRVHSICNKSKTVKETKMASLQWVPGACQQTWPILHAPELPLATLPCLPSASPLTALIDPSLPSLLQKLKNMIIKHDYTDFNDLLSANLYPVHAYPSSNNLTLAIEPQATSALAFVPTQQTKCHINGLSS